MNNKNDDKTVEGFDLIELIENNHFNSLKSIELLKNDGFWTYFIKTTTFYNQIATIPVPEKFYDPLHNILFHYLSSSSIDLIKGTTNIVGGHFTDSGLYLRRSIESIRHSIFIRENPEQAKHLLDPNQEVQFKKSYTDWIRHNGNGIVNKEFPYHKDHFDHESSFAAHPGHKLFSTRHEIEVDGNEFIFKLNYSELTPNKKGYAKLLSAFFWTIQIHTNCINWWIKHSNIIPTLSEDQQMEFQLFKEELNIDYIRIRAAVKSTLSDDGR